MRRIHFEVGETAVSVISDEPFLKVAKDAIFRAREIILSKIEDDPFFKMTYDPYEPDCSDDPLIQSMCSASKLAGVGPMAGVAGAVASFAVKAMKDAGSTFAIVENGGDIALIVDREITVGLYSDDNSLGDLALSVGTTNKITGICSSSGRVGPSISFGNSSICTVLSDDVVLADECATALGNMIVKGEHAEMSDATEEICNIPGIIGCIAYCNGLVAMCGDVPDLKRAHVDPDSASRILF